MLHISHGPSGRRLGTEREWRLISSHAEGISAEGAQDSRGEGIPAEEVQGSRGECTSAEGAQDSRGEGASADGAQGPSGLDLLSQL